MNATPPAPFPLVEIAGDPRARGRAHGEGARERVRLSAEHYVAQLSRIGLTRAEVAETALGFLPALDAFAPDLVEEMRGVAEGAGITLADVTLVNARTEVLQIAQRRAGGRDDDPDGCTGAVALPETTADGVLIHGQNWDWKADCVETSVVLRIRRTDGPDILTFTEAGGLARSGFNAAGIAITANYLECDRDYRATGVPLPFIRRRALEAAHYALAIRVVATTQKSGSNNMMLSHQAGEAVDLECAPDEAFILHPEDGLLVHANHWRSAAALSKLRETGLASVPDSVYRDERVRRALAGRRGRIDAEAFKAALFDDFGAPYSVCRPPLRKEGGNLSATVAMIVMRPSLGLMEIAPLPALNRAFTQYRLEMQSAPAAAAE